MSRLAIVVPCYNEEEMLPITFEELREVLHNLIEKNKITEDSFLLFVDDGSKDKTWEVISKEHARSPKDVFGLKLARNVGHQNALIAGLSKAKDLADIVVSIDADLQDDTAAIVAMVDAYHEGNDIVYGVRNSRKTDSFFKRNTAQVFYRLLSAMGVETIYNHADYRLMSRRALEQLLEYKETNLYLRGMIPLIGYKTAEVYYERKERTKGESKYPFSKMLSLALNGITSFSVKPIRLIAALGCFILLGCLAAAIYAFASYFMGNVEKGWTSLILSIWFLGGVQLLSIGVIGEYIGKIYMEVKQRPKYNVEMFLKQENTDEY